MFKNERPVVLSIGGHDPSNGAGIGADVKTMEFLKVIGLTVCSAQTIQTDKTVRMIEWIEEDLVLGQVVALLDRFNVDSVKISMVKDLELICDCAEKIRLVCPDTRIIWDPIIESSSGYPFIQSLTNQLLREILHRVDGIIPNFSEWETIEQIMKQTPAELANTTFTNIIVKGGHDSMNKGVDMLYTPSETYEFKPFDILKGYEKHGSGCMFSTALACYLAMGYSWQKATQSAKSFTYHRMVSNTSLLAYYEPDK